MQHVSARLTDICRLPLERTLWQSGQSRLAALAVNPGTCRPKWPLALYFPKTSQRSGSLYKALKQPDILLGRWQSGGLGAGNHARLLLGYRHGERAGLVDCVAISMVLFKQRVGHRVERDLGRFEALALVLHGCV